jgi:cytosine/adenosine deaminase-related metal-dependent hydrolase
VTATLHAAEVVLPVAVPPIRHGAVAVDGDRVVWVGRRRDWTGTGPVRTWPGLLAPGLVNAHCHLQYTAYADMYEPGVDFLDWISVFARRNRTMTPDGWRESTEAGVAELVRTGTTAVADVAAHPVVVQVAAGLAGISYLEAVGADEAGWPALRPVFLDRLAARTDRTVGVSPHTLYTLGSGVVRDCVRLARERGMRLHPHLAESPYEVEFVATGSGPFAAANLGWGLAMELQAAGGSARSPAAELAGLGALGPDVHVAHGVHCDAADRALLREHRTTVALCPRSNRTLGVGEAPVAAYRAEGSPVAIGTDSRASAPSLDLLADVGALRETALRQGSPAAGLDRWLVEAATVGGARAMGMEGGTLGPGSRADLAVFDVDPAGDPYAALAGAAGRCIGTVLAGRTVHDLVH